VPSLCRRDVAETNQRRYGWKPCDEQDGARSRRCCVGY
jgi:hypothetical protein